MAGLLDYYKENPDLWAENEYLLKKDPAYDLGMMDLGVMNFEDRLRGRWSHPNFITSLVDDQSRYSPRRSGLLGVYNPFPDTKKGVPSRGINLHTGPFTEGDTPTYWDDPDVGNPPSEMRNKPISNLDKARVLTHEARHKQTHENPELYEAQPSWTGLNVQPDDPEAEESWIQKLFGLGPTAEHKASKKEHWRNEAFNRYMDFQYFPDWEWRGKSATKYPRGLSSKDLRPTDMYFDKIWRDHWKPYAKNYEKIQKRIAERRNVPGTPIVPMGRGRGRDEPSGGGQRGSNAPGFTDPGKGSYGPWKSQGGIIAAF